NFTLASWLNESLVSRARYYLSSNTKLTLYYTLIYPVYHLPYSTWLSTQRIANIIIINYCPRCFSSCSLKIGKYTVMIQEYPIAIDHINCRTNLKQFTILYQGPKIWNSLPISISGLTRFFTFKRKIIEFINKMNPNWPSRKSTT
ncbi:hypothetical protein pdam_00000495, partial [Pocillopora damicornis]